MPDLNAIDSQFLEARTTRELLELLKLHANTTYANRPDEFRDSLTQLAGFDRAFRESLADAISLRLEREDSHVETIGREFEPFMQIVAALRLARLERELRNWIDRHLVDQPSTEGEKRFALAVWALMQVSAIDSHSFVAWWTERAKKHKGSWIETHLKSDAVPAPITRH